MPPIAEERWLQQFENSETLDPMSQEWWRLRARNLFVAYEDGNEARPLGDFALTIVYAHERFSNPTVISPFKHPLFYELRGLVVDDSCRGQGVGQKLVEAALHQAAISEERLPTFAITTNPIAAKLFEKAGATNHPSKEEFPYKSVRASDYNKMACWSRLEEEPRYCDACPINNNTAWWWPTHRKPSTSTGSSEAGS